MPVNCNIRSASVDLPWSICAMMQKLRMIAGSVAPGTGALAAMDILLKSGQNISFAPLYSHTSSGFEQMG